MNPQNQIDQLAHLSLKCTVHECIDRTVKFVSLWKKLEKKEYIYTASDVSETRIFPFFPNQNHPPSPDFMFTEITRDFEQKVFFPNEELKAFREREYKTSKEALNENEERYRKKSFSLAFGTALVAVITSISTTLFIHKNSTNERVVTVKNAEVFSDTIRVLLIDGDSVNTTIDTKIHQRDSTKSSDMTP